MTAALGITPFFCCSQLHEQCLTEDEKSMADNSWVEYAAVSFEWIRNCKIYSTGLNVGRQGKELPKEDVQALGPHEDEIRRVIFYPLLT